MGELFKHFPVDLIPKNSLEQRLVDGYERGSDLYDINDMITKDGLRLPYLLLAKSSLEKAQELIEPKSFEEFEGLRNIYWLEQVGRYVSYMRKHKDVPGQDLFSVYNEHKLWHAFLNSLGYEVDKDWGYYNDFFFDNNSELKYKRPLVKSKLTDLLTELSTPLTSSLKPQDKIMEENKAALNVGKYIEQGYRVGVTFGKWDLHHPGHDYFLSKAKHVLGRSGKLIVGVSSDEEIKLLKGTVPVWNQAQRVNILSNRSDVDAVVVLSNHSYVPNLTSDTISEYYSRLITKLSPHFRMIGTKDDNFDLYSQQAKEAGIGIIYSGHDRLTSTTKLIKEIVERFGHTNSE